MSRRSNQASCRMYDAIVTNQQNQNSVDLTNTTQPDATSPLPWLYYPDSTYLRDKNMGVKCDFCVFLLFPPKVFTVG